MPPREVTARTQTGKSTAYLMRLGKGVTIDAGPHLDVLARYINDNADPTKINCRFVKDPASLCARVHALRDLAPGEELFVKYGAGYWRLHADLNKG